MESIALKLTIVNKFRSASVAKSYGDVPSIKSEAIRAVLIDREQDDEKIELVGDLLMDWSDADCWVACRCTGSSIQEAPILHPRVSAAAADAQGAEDRFVLVRMGNRAPHHEGCPYFGDTKAEHPVATDRGPRAVAQGLSVLTATHSRQATANGGGAHLAESSPRGKRIPTMARVLFTLLEGSKLHELNVKKIRLDEQLLSLQQSIARRYMDDAGKFSAAPWVRTSLNEFNMLAGLLIAERDAKIKTWPSGLRPHGLIVDHVEKVRERDGRLFLAPTKGQEREVHGRVRRPGADTKGPYVAIMLVTVPASGGPPLITQAYLHPAADSKSMLLVDSDLERGTLRELLKLQAAMWADGKNKVKIEKPYLDHYGPGIRPDFIVGLGGKKKVVVETMGYIGEDYAERKQRTQEEMLVVGTVLHDEAPHDTIGAKVKEELLRS